MIKKQVGYISFLLCFLMRVECVHAETWFIGPLLAQMGSNIPAGHTNLQTYGYFIKNNGFYDEFGHASQVENFNNTIINPLLSHGLSDQFDIQLSLPYQINQSQGRQQQNIGDVGALLGWQITTQNEQGWQPNLRITFQETLPSGRYDRLSEIELSTDATGLGSYQSNFGLSSDYLLQMKNNSLQTTAAISYTIASPVAIQGLSYYGGTTSTTGTVSLGDIYTLDLAFELTLTQHWVAVMEGYYMHQSRGAFHGRVDINEDLASDTLGNMASDQYTLLPGLEYNFSENIGLIAGVWYTIKGHNTSKFTAGIIALNLYW